MIKYKGKIISIGPMVEEFRQAGILVFFGEGVPEELVEYSIVHDAKDLVSPVEIGDLVTIEKETYKVLAVGDVANTNLANLGHLILKFNGDPQARLPGDVNVEEKPVPEIQVGSEIKIEQL